MTGVGLGPDGRQSDHALMSPSPTLPLHPAPTQEVDEADIQVQVCLYAFDLIFLNGEVSSGCVSRLPGGDGGGGGVSWGGLGGDGGRGM